MSSSDTSSTIDLSIALVPGNCYSNKVSIGSPITKYGYSCAPHFYCPNATALNPVSLPQICPPSNKCQLERLATKFCEPQGPYEPQICKKGYYCPDYKSIFKCPENYYCPPGSIQPRACPAMSLCSEGAVVPTFYGGILICVLLDIFLVIVFFIIKIIGKRSAAAANKSDAKIAPDAEPTAKELKIAQKSVKDTREVVVDVPDDGGPPAFSEATASAPIRTTENVSSLPPIGNGRLNSPPQTRNRRQSIQPQSVLGLTDTGFIPTTLQANYGMTGSQIVEEEEEEGEEDMVEVKEKGKSAKDISQKTSNEFQSGRKIKDDKPRKDSLTQGLPQQEVQVVVAGEVRNLSSLERKKTAKEGNLADELELKGLTSGFRSALNDREDLRIDFHFENLGLKLKDDKVVLRGVTGTIRSRRLTAIMGPSGAGKTTFMNVLMGKVSRTGGKLFINGKEAEMSKFKKIIGYVPQEDIMLREMTVRENILHSARVRLPSNWSKAKVEEFVDHVLEVLNLSHVQSNLIGDETTRGVSGGQRKRVNIGMELAAVPLALFLDEPTSGLDSTAALKVAEILKRIASIGLTVVAVIHQPRFEIFQQFDDILMIAPGGKTAYLGPTKSVLEYFEMHGFFFDPRANPADILMDILSDKGVNLRQHLSPEDLVNLWEAEGREWIKKKYEEDGVPKANEDPATKSSEESNIEEIDHVIKNRGASWLGQVLLCHNRYMVQQYRLVSALGLEIGVASLAGGLMGVAVADGAGELFIGVPVDPYSLISPATLQWLIPQLGLLIGISCGLAGAPAGVKVFGEEKSVYWREAAAGHNKLSYFLGKVFASTYRFVLTAFHFAAIFSFLATPMSNFGILFANLFLQFYCVYGLAAVISMIVRRENAALLAVVTCLFASVFCGYGPTVKSARKWGIEFVWHLSYNRWATEAFFSEELSVFKDVYDIEGAAEHYGYVLDKSSLNLLYMFLIGIGLRLTAFVFMILLNRDKQK
ncbi:hypothetical protein HDU97_005189 [Phlyctochytrium planicorne]|nr:hypothetical protein HDU97_005189 [Phlyctochytrium planicorne]